MSKTNNIEVTEVKFEFDVHFITDRVVSNKVDTYYSICELRKNLLSILKDERVSVLVFSKISGVKTGGWIYDGVKSVDRLLARIEIDLLEITEITDSRGDCDE